MTLCRAIPSDLRPMRHGVDHPIDAIEHDHAVGRLRRDGRAPAAHRDPDVGERKRGRVVHAVAHHHHRAEVGIRAQRANDVELVLGRLLRVHAIRSERLPDRVRDGGAVAGHHRDVPDARDAKLVTECDVRVLPHVVAHDDCAGQRAVDADEDPRAAAVEAAVELRAAASAPA